MKHVVTLLVICGLFVCFADVNQALEYREVWRGDFSDDSANPTLLGQLDLGSNTMIGSVEGGDYSDVFTFEIGVGYQLESVIVTNFANTGPWDYTSLKIRHDIAGDIIEFINFSERDIGLDLLQFDSAPGPQGAGLYTIEWFGNNAIYSNDYSLDLVVSEAPMIPEPGSLALLGIGLISLLFIRRKR